ncbi:MAG: electron transfer flavoprotein subunit beta/FixA family protein [Spirochaetales bacterium]|nr:electron transfer flavoprotein subunit beta/FixA family protein [Spirochaetales bacterium]
MRIVVFLKQVPKQGEAEMQDDFTLDRSRGGRLLNPADKSALLMASSLRKRLGGEILCLSMGPPSAEEVLREAAMDGADQLYLISDTLYAGSDTLATSRVLAAALEYLGKPELVLCGRRAVDGETGQVGPETSVRLGYSCVTNVISVEESGKTVRVERLLETKIQTLSVVLPAVICVCETNTLSQLPGIETLRRAAAMHVETLTNAELRIPNEKCGSAGSPTKVLEIHRRAFEKRKARYVFDTGDALELILPVLGKFIV